MEDEYEYTKRSRRRWKKRRLINKDDSTSDTTWRIWTWGGEYQYEGYWYPLNPWEGGEGRYKREIGPPVLKEV